MDPQAIQMMVAHVAAATDPAKLADFMTKYATDKIQTTAADLAVRPVVRLIKRRFGVRSDEDRALVADELALEVGRLVDFATCLEDRVAKLEVSQDISDADIFRRLRAPSMMHLIERGARGATETSDPSAAVILAELVTSRLRYDEDTSASRSLQRAVGLASELTTTDLLLIGGIALVTVPDAVEPTYREFVQTRNLGIYRSLLDLALPRLFIHPPIRIQLTDLESIGILVHELRETPGQPIQHRSPIELVVTRLLGEIPQNGTDPGVDSGAWLRPRSSLSRAARLAVPTDDGVTVSDREPVLVNYQLTSVGWRLAEAVLRGAVQLNVSMADQLSSYE
jgi:hypothetical protein